MNNYDITTDEIITLIGRRDYNIYLDRKKGMTFKAIGEINGLTLQRIRQLNEKAMRKINNYRFDGLLFSERVRDRIIKSGYFDRDAVISAINDNRLNPYDCNGYGHKSHAIICEKYGLENRYI